MGRMNRIEIRSIPVGMQEDAYDPTGYSPVWLVFPVGNRIKNRAKKLKGYIRRRNQRLRELRMAEMWWGL